MMQLNIPWPRIQLISQLFDERKDEPVTAFVDVLKKLKKKWQNMKYLSKKSAIKELENIPKKELQKISKKNYKPLSKEPRPQWISKNCHIKNSIEFDRVTIEPFIQLMTIILMCI